MSLAEMSNCWKTQNYQNLSESFMKLLDLLICLREKLRNKFCLHQGIHLELRVLIFFFFVLSSRTMLPASLKKSVLKESSFEEKKSYSETSFFISFLIFFFLNFFLLGSYEYPFFCQDQNDARILQSSCGKFSQVSLEQQA